MGFVFLAVLAQIRHKSMTKLVASSDRKQEQELLVASDRPGAAGSTGSSYHIGNPLKHN